MFFKLIAPFYDFFMTRVGLDHSAEITGIVNPRSGLSVLDLGGGTGLNDAKLVEKGASVTILDRSEAMLNRARQKNLPIELVRGNAEQMPFEDETFDVVLISDAWHHFDAQKKVAREVRRVLKPLGRVVVVEFDPRRPKIRILAALEKMVGEPSAFQTPKQLAAVFQAAGIKGASKDKPPIHFVFTGLR